MNKDDILSASRRENKNRDLAELDASARAGNLAGRVGALVCCLVSFLASAVADILLYSPWIIYFSIMGTHWLVRFVRLKKKSELVLAVMFLILALLGLYFFVQRLFEVSAWMKN